MEMPKPTDAHRKLQKLIGAWTGEELLSPTPWDPKGGTAVARVHNRMALDGFAVVQDYEQERGGVVNFRGHGVFGWDPEGQTYTMHWFDTMGMPPNVYRGTFQGDVLTLTSKLQQGHSRAVFNLLQQDKYAFHMEVSPDGQQWTKVLEGNYSRSR